MEDPEKALLEGYPSLAHLMCQGSNNAVFMRFSELGTRALLYKQSEVNDLRVELKRLDCKDFFSSQGVNDNEARRVAKDWREYSKGQHQTALERRALMSRIHEELPKYYTMLLQQSEISRMRAPPRRTLQTFQEWFTGRKLFHLTGPEDLLYQDLEDIVALDPIEEDRLTLTLNKLVGWLYADIVLDKVDNRVLLRASSDSEMRMLANVVAVLLSMVLLVAPTVLLLVLAESLLAVRLGIVVAFIVAFVLIVGLLTNIRRSELFAGTAAYAAVLVVFVSSTQPDG